MEHNTLGRSAGSEGHCNRETAVRSNHCNKEKAVRSDHCNKEQAVRSDFRLRQVQHVCSVRHTTAKLRAHLCNTLQHTATHGNTTESEAKFSTYIASGTLLHIFDLLSPQHNATQLQHNCNTTATQLQHNCNAMQRPATQQNLRQRAAHM